MLHVCHMSYVIGLLVGFANTASGERCSRGDPLPPPPFQLVDSWLAKFFRNEAIETVFGLNSILRAPLVLLQLARCPTCLG
jgi:hypothetical protein